MKSRPIAILFALLLGGIGAHKFYLGQYGLGLLYLIFCWTWIPLVVSLVEAVFLIAIGQEAFDVKYNPTYMTPTQLRKYGSLVDNPGIGVRSWDAGTMEGSKHVVHEEDL